MSKELKPCPFCGKKPVLIIVPETMERLIVCSECCNQFPHKTEEEAIDAWNRRRTE